MELELESMGMLSDSLLSTSSPAVAAAKKLRRYMTNYGLIHAEAIAAQVGMNVIDVKKAFHVCKQPKQVRVGSLALQTLCTMLHLTITLVTNDHRYTVRSISPWKNIASLVNGDMRHLVWNYILPTSQYIHGHYRVLRSTSPLAKFPAPLVLSDWLSLDEMMVRTLAFVIQLNQLTVVENDAQAAALQQGILDAVWEACDQNPKRFQSFQWTSKQYGTTTMSGPDFYQFLEKLFRPVGAAYVTDFLVHVLPVPQKRQALMQARWVRFHTELMVKRASMMHLHHRRSSFESTCSASTTSTSHAIY
jgi:hypothetical protein